MLIIKCPFPPFKADILLKADIHANPRLSPTHTQCTTLDTLTRCVAYETKRKELQIHALINYYLPENERSLGSSQTCYRPGPIEETL